MAIQVIERPYKICWSRNPIRYGLHTDSDLSQSGFAIEVRLMHRPFASNDQFIEMIRLPLMPDDHGNAYVDVRNLLNGLVSYNMPDLSTSGIEPAFSQTIEFYMDFRELTEAAPDAEWVSDGANTRFAVKGGISYAKWQGANYFVTYKSNLHPFLTWYPSGKFCGADEIMFLYYLHTTIAADAISLKVTITYTDGTVNVASTYGSIAAPKLYGVYMVPAGIAQLALDQVDNTRTIHYYDVELVNAGGTVAGPYRYQVDYRNFYSRQQFNYINSLGGLDSVRIRGEVEPVLKYSFDAIERNTDGGYLNALQLPAQYASLNTTEQRTYKGNVGYLPKADQDALRDAILNRQVFEPRDGRWLPVLITQAEHKPGTNRDKLWSFDLEWQTAWADTNYTPEDTIIGDLPACPVPTNLRVSAIDGSNYTLAWDGDPQHDSYIIEASGYTNPSPPFAAIFLDWDTIGSNETTTFTYEASFWSEVSFRIRANCASSNSPASNVVTVNP